MITWAYTLVIIAILRDQAISGSLGGGIFILLGLIDALIILGSMGLICDAWKESIRLKIQEKQ